ncbi:TRAP transporter small permease [Mesorhizobium tamadayense]|uniref:TRAP transporter small permease protein n=1 Tax=Mesorhizobium tamadayense TaxID=425306 RepID=A0A3P3F4R0_9HYPH|nr:TRAP transporter small permease [Mesorhizobium tamadayense]
MAVCHPGLGCVWLFSPAGEPLLPRDHDGNDTLRSQHVSDEATLDIALRNLFNHPLFFTNEFSGYLLVLIAFLGLPAGLRSGSLLRIELLLALMPGGVRWWLAIAYNLVALAMSLVLLWQVCIELSVNYGRSTLAPALHQTPIWLPQLVMG